MVRLWRYNRILNILIILISLMCLFNVVMKIIDAKINIAIFYIFFLIYFLVFLWLRNKKPVVIVSNETLTISQNLFHSKVIECGNIREIINITKRKISFLVQERDFEGELFLKKVNIYLGIINKDERESLIQTIKEHFESSRKPQEILPANQILE